MATVNSEEIFHISPSSGLTHDILFQKEKMTHWASTSQLLSEYRWLSPFLKSY